MPFSIQSTIILAFERDLYRFNLRTHGTFSWLQYESGYSHSLTDCDHGNLSAIIHKSKTRNIQSCETSHCSQTQKNLLCVWYYLQECGFVDSKPYKWLLCPSYYFNPTFMYLCKCFCEDVGTYQLITPHFFSGSHPPCSINCQYHNGKFLAFLSTTLKSLCFCPES
jgi:hypothetical protein